MTKQSIKAVTFDAGGTLIHLGESVGSSYSRIAREFDLEISSNSLDSAFREVWKATPQPFQKGCLVLDEMEWWKGLVRQVVSRAGGGDVFDSSVHYEVFFDRLYGYFAEPGVWCLDPDALEVLGHLEKIGVKKAIVSNFDRRLLQILSGLGVLDRFDVVVLSNDLGVSKPSREIFEHAAEQLGLFPAEILHVGDDLHCDWDGAVYAGMQAMLVGKGHGRLNEIIEKLPLAPF